MSPEPEAAGSSKQAGTQPPACCPLYHEAVELIGRRWTGAIVAVLLDHGPMRFSEIAQAVPELSDRLLSERMKELESRGVVVRHVESGPPVKVTYELSPCGHAFQDVALAIQKWGHAMVADARPRRR